MRKLQKTKPLTEEEINYDILNALNLQHPQLGETYLKFRWNPLGDDFKLELPYIEKYLKKTKDKTEILSPDFIEKHTQAKESFRLALKNNREMLLELQNRYNNGDFYLYKNVDISEQVKDILFFLQCRGKMLELALKLVKSNKISTFEAYKNITSINKKLSQLLEEAYSLEFNKNLAIQNFILECEREAKKKKEKFKDLGLAKSISKSIFNLFDIIEDRSEKNKIGSLVQSLAQMAGKFVAGMSGQLSSNLSKITDKNKEM